MPCLSRKCAPSWELPIQRRPFDSSVFYRLQGRGSAHGLPNSHIQCRALCGLQRLFLDAARYDHFHYLPNFHLVPVVFEFPPTFQADNIGFFKGVRSGLRARRERESSVAVRARE